MKAINKLVRDRIPVIIQEQGRKATTRILDDKEYISELRKKLQEEAQEFLTDDTLEELADVMEVIYALAKAKGASKEELENIRKNKAKERGRFEDKIFLIEAE
jgi:predicted house-cleaning noncanonical NTP pyrophosphatase (MazG superfamily)